MKAGEQEQVTRGEVQGKASGEGRNEWSNEEIRAVRREMKVKVI